MSISDFEKYPTQSLRPLDVPLEVKLLTIISVWEGARHGDYGSFRFQMSHKKMLDGDYVPLHFWSLETLPCITNAQVRLLSH